MSEKLLYQACDIMRLSILECFTIFYFLLSEIDCQVSIKCQVIKFIVKSNKIKIIKTWLGKKDVYFEILTLSIFWR